MVSSLTKASEIFCPWCSSRTPSLLSSMTAFLTVPKQILHIHVDTLSTQILPLWDLLILAAVVVLADLYVRVQMFKHTPSVLIELLGRYSRSSNELCYGCWGHYGVSGSFSTYWLENWFGTHWESPLSQWPRSSCRPSSHSVARGLLFWGLSLNIWCLMVSPKRLWEYKWLWFFFFLM